MNIVFVVHDLAAKDGWSRYAHDLGRTLSERGHTVSALVSKVIPGITWAQQYVCLRAPLHSLSIRGVLSQWWKTWRTLCSIKPDIVHVVCEPYGVLFSCLPGNWNITMTLHGSYAVLPFSMGGLVRYGMKRCFLRARNLIAVSHFTKYFLKEREPEFFRECRLEDKIYVIHNSINLSHDIQIVHRPSNEIVKNIIGVGAVKHRKGYIQVVRALAEFRRTTGIPFHYDLVGSLEDAVYVEQVRKEIFACHLEKEVRILGMVSEKELHSLYNTADLFLLLSLSEGVYVEGFVLGFIEAAARGIPCIGPNTGGCPEAISHGESGYICDPYDPRNVACAMEKILRCNSIDRKRCREWAEAHDLQKVVPSIEEVYRTASRSSIDK